MFLKDRVNFSSKREYTPEGYLKAAAVIARTGVQEYYAAELERDDLDPFTLIRVYRPPEEVFDEESMRSFANKPLTNNHPPESVNSSNFLKYAVGFSGDTVSKKDEKYLETTILVTEEGAIRDVESGKTELSNGYISDLEWTPGVSPDGEKYDAVQRGIRGNHIAIVQRGRCGSACRVSDHDSPTDLEPNMVKITVDGVEYEVSDQVKQVVHNLQSKVSDAEQETQRMKDEAEKAKSDLEKKEEEDEKEKERMKSDHEAEMKAVKDELAAAQARVPTPETLDALVENRLKTRDAALSIDPQFNCDGKDCETIRKEIVAAQCADVDVTKVDASYIRARFDALASSGAGSHLDNAITGLHRDNRREEKVLSADEARQKFTARNRDRWKAKKGGNA